HYLANKAVYVANATRRRQTVGNQRLALIVGYLRQHPCVDCGEEDVEVLEFDHLADKEFSIARGFRDRTWEAVLREIAKCQVVCANCHRRRTARRGGFARVAIAARAASLAPQSAVERVA